MFAWSKEEVLSMKLPEEWTKGVFEISVEDPMSTLMLIWIVGEASRAGCLKCSYFSWLILEKNILSFQIDTNCTAWALSKLERQNSFSL